MRTKQFKAESKKLLDMMINSIYTHKEIFLRELISNASDAIDKLYFRSLTDTTIPMKHSDYYIQLAIDGDARTLTIRDNGCGMTAEELEHNLGTIAKSGSLDFKEHNEKKEDVEIIGQFGVGFYSAFMVADHVTVDSRAYGTEQANRWQSSGVAGYTIEPLEDFDGFGTLITLHLKEDTENERYSEYLQPWSLKELVTKYSDYIRYPIKLEMPERRLKESPKEESSEDNKDGSKEDAKEEYETVYENKTINSMIPLWRKNKSEVKEEEYNNFYKSKFYDYDDPAAVIHTKTEGAATFASLLFIPKHAPVNYYSTTYEKGLQLYSRGVLIMDKCADLLPDYFSFVRGLVDSEDLSLNISRETLQHDHQLKLISRTLEKRIKNELEKMLKNDREKYEALWKEFGIQLTYGLCLEYGSHKEMLQDLLLFYSSTEKKLSTLNEYIERMKEGQDTIYYACGKTVEAIDALPQTEEIKDKGYEILYMTNSVDEFAIQVLHDYGGKKLSNICTDQIDLETEDEKKALAEENEAGKEMFSAMKDALDGRVQKVQYTGKLRQHPVCLTTEGKLSLDMQRTLNNIPGQKDQFKADVVLEVNKDHPVTAKLKELFVKDPETLKKYTKLLYAEGCLIGGVPIEKPAELCDLMNELLIK